MEEGKLQVMPDIEKFKFEDGIERYYIDTYEKLYWIVNKRFKEQKENDPNAKPIIDLSNLKIIFKEGFIPFWVGCLVGKIDGIISIGNKKEFDPNNISINQEVQFEVKYQVNFKDSIIYNIAFGKTSFCNFVNFFNIAFVNGADFKGSTFEEVGIYKINIEQKKDDGQGIKTLIGNIIFSNITFNSKIKLTSLSWTDFRHIDITIVR